MKAARERPAGETGSLGDAVEAVRATRRFAHRVEGLCEAVRIRGPGDGTFYELRLPALSMGRKDDLPGEAKRCLRTVAGTHEVETAIEPGGNAGRCHDITIVDVKHIRVDDDVGIYRLQLLGIGPMRRGSPPRKQSGRSNSERSKAQSDNQCAVPVRSPKRFRQKRRWRIFEISPAWDDHNVGVVEAAKSMRCSDGQPGFGMNWPALDCADPEVEAWQAERRAVLAEHQAWHGEVERADAIEGEGGNNRIGHGSTN